jgi:hypothetical protein
MATDANEMRLHRRRLRSGWTLNLWRMSSPHNYWIEGKRGAMQSLDLFTFLELRAMCGEPEHSPERVPDIWGTGRRMPSRHTVWRAAE